MYALLQEAANTPGIPWMGILIPASIFLIAFIITLMLYRHFARSIRSE